MDRIAILGAQGQLGQELQLGAFFPDHSVVYLGRNTLDITNPLECEKLSEMKPQWIINCAAYTQVDKAEEDADSCYAVNAEGVRNIARVANIIGAKVIHISSDYVYDNGLARPLREPDPCHPKGIYARSKYEGENHLRQNHDQCYILRTSWVYGLYGNNFVKTMMRLSEKHKTLSVVSDQVGCPTWTRDIAHAVSLLVQHTPEYGIYNFTGMGQCSWHRFAQEIFDILSKKVIVQPISTQDYGAPAARPAYSVLDCSKIDLALGIERLPWQQTLRSVLSLF